MDLAPDGIRVNSVNPGVTVTDLHKRSGLDSTQYNAFIERSVQVTHPLGAALGRVGQADEVGELIAFLVSDKARFITGDCIAIDGGRQVRACMCCALWCCIETRPSGTRSRILLHPFFFCLAAGFRVRSA